MTTWITSDLHLDHNNIMKYCPDTRQHYSDVSHMNEAIVSGWNSKVAPTDTVYILGDVAFCNAQKAVGFLSRMTGNKILIEGNHDQKLLQDASFRACFTEIHKYHEVKHNGTLVCMLHYRIAEWNQCHRGSVHFFGHAHGAGGLLENRSMDVGIDATNEIVSDMSVLVARMLRKELTKHH